MLLQIEPIVVAAATFAATAAATIAGYWSHTAADATFPRACVCG